jgi:hypothetical protein
MVTHDVDLPGPAELVEVVHIVRPEIDLERVEDLAQRDPQGHALGPVDLELEPGGVDPRAVEEPSMLGGPIALEHDLVANPLDLGEAEVAPVLDDQLEAAGRPQAVDRGRTEGRVDRASDLLAAASPKLGGDGVGG